MILWFIMVLFQMGRESIYRMHNLEQRGTTADRRMWQWSVGHKLTGRGYLQIIVGLTQTLMAPEKLLGLTWADLISPTCPITCWVLSVTWSCMKFRGSSLSWSIQWIVPFVLSNRDPVESYYSWGFVDWFRLSKDLNWDLDFGNLENSSSQKGLWYISLWLRIQWMKAIWEEPLCRWSKLYIVERFVTRGVWGLATKVINVSNSIFVLCTLSNILKRLL